MSKLKNPTLNNFKHDGCCIKRLSQLSVKYEKSDISFHLFIYDFV